MTTVYRTHLRPGRRRREGVRDSYPKRQVQTRQSEVTGGRGGMCGWTTRPLDRFVIEALSTSVPWTCESLLPFPLSLDFFSFLLPGFRW